MRRNGRALAALGLLALLVALAGCSGAFGPSGPNEQQLNETATYDWNSTADASYTITKAGYRAVIDLRDVNATELRLSRRDSLGSRQPLQISALQFRYPNGTQTGFDSFNISTQNRRTVVVPPEPNGTIAFSADRARGKEFSTRVFVEGTHNVTLPANTRVGVPMLSRVRPGGASRSVDPETNRLTLSWDALEERQSPVIVRYYLQRDLLLFGGLFGILSVAGIGGALYYFREIRVLERQREEIGLDVDTEDDDLDDDGPPPGMG